MKYSVKIRYVRDWKFEFSFRLYFYFLLRSKSDSNDLLSSEKRSPFLYEKISVDIRHKQDEAPETGAAVFMCHSTHYLHANEFRS